MKEEVIPYEPTSLLEKLPGHFPVATFDDPSDYEAIAAPLVHALAHPDVQYFTDDAIWRDLFALTGTLRTFYSSQTVVAAWSETTALRRARNFKYQSGSGATNRLDEQTAWVNLTFNFEVVAKPATQNSVVLSVIPVEGGQWKIWLVRTVLEQLTGYPDVDQLAPVEPNAGSIETTQDLTNGVNGHNSGDSGPDPTSDSSLQHFEAVVVGAGQAGLSCAGRLQALGVSHIAIDKNKAVGDNWLNRYESTRLHTLRDYGHLPFGCTFSDRYQQFLTKYDIAEGHKEWVQKYGIHKNLWLSTTLESGSWDEKSKLWTLNIRRLGQPQKLTTYHVILAVGPGGQIPITPELPGKEIYQGTVLHSSEYDNPRKWKGKAGIVVGTANTAHDVAEDMVEAGLSSITMVQRRRTYVLPAHYLNNVASKSFNATVPTLVADRDQQSMPNVLGRLLFQKVLNSQADHEPERFDSLERAGFRVARHGDLMWHIIVRSGGHYMDVGCSELISKGQIQMKSDARISHYTVNGLGFSDGTEIPAEVIVFCTGFVGDNRSEVTRLFGKQVADRTNELWGVDEEGEVKGAFKNSGHPGLWFIGGAIAYARFFSRFIAFQIKTDLLGQRLPVYNGQRRNALPKKVDGELVL